MARILLTGGSGFLGYNLVKTLKNNYECIFTYNNHPVAIPDVWAYPLNLLQYSKFNKILDEFSPEVVIHSAAMSHSQECENKKELALKVNADATKYIVDTCHSLDIKVVFISTDLVFDGELGFYKEVDKPNPVSFYGSTKALAEEEVGKFKNNLIIRSALMYGLGNEYHNCFLKWMKEGLQSNGITLYTDEYRSPIYVLDLADAIKEIIEQDISGIIHLAGPERLNRYEMGLIFCEEFNYDKRKIRAMTLKEADMEFKRAKDCSLSILQAKSILKTELRNFRAGLQDLKRRRKYENWSYL